MKHKKKILSKYFEAVCNGTKTFEIRNEDDCRYEIGDLIELVEIDVEFCGFGVSDYYSTGRTKIVEVTYRLDGNEFPEGINQGYVVLGIKLRIDEE